MTLKDVHPVDIKPDSKYDKWVSNIEICFVKNG